MTLSRRVIGMVKATHFGPTVLVVSISFTLAITQLSFSKSFEITLAILAGQCVVGWTNELVDQERDTEAGRTKKPLVNGSVSRKQLQIGVGVALSAAILLSFLGPLGGRGGWLHLLGLGSATVYNFWAKSTWLSPLPYAISFGALSWAIYSAAHKSPAPWLYIDFVSVSVSFHFLNVIKDLEWDVMQGIQGAPQRLGKRGSVAAAVILVLAAVLLGIGRPS
jgi:4-hydroxybenzoate polyprenyltransferase